MKSELEEIPPEEEEEEDLNGSVWMPVIVENKEEKKQYETDPSVKEIDLAAISEKEVFVRKANIVSLNFYLLKIYRLISKRVLITVNLLCM